VLKVEVKFLYWARSKRLRGKGHGGAHDRSRQPLVRDRRRQACAGLRVISCKEQMFQTLVH